MDGTGASLMHPIKTDGKGLKPRSNNLFPSDPQSIQERGRSKDSSGQVSSVTLSLAEAEDLIN